MVFRTQRMATGVAIAALVALALAGAPALVAAETPAATKAETLEDASRDLEVELPFGGMTVAIDPATGKLRPPTPAQARELAKQMAAHFGKHAGQPVRVLQHRNGMLSAVLSPENMDFSVATVDENGKLRFQCVDSVEKAAEATVSSPALEVM